MLGLETVAFGASQALSNVDRASGVLRTVLPSAAVGTIPDLGYTSKGEAYSSSARNAVQKFLVKIHLEMSRRLVN